ncbi:hypothetical protein [Thalassiella azotivora]
MSQVATAARAARPGTARPPARTTERPRPPRLTVVTPPPRQRGRLPFALGCTALLVLSLLGLLMLNISLSRGAYQMHELQAEATRLAEREQALSEDLAARAAPAQLAVSARELGMVPSTSPGFIRLSDGAVLGEPAPAEPGTAPADVVGARPASTPPSVPASGQPAPTAGGATPGADGLATPPLDGPTSPDRADRASRTGSAGGGGQTGTDGAAATGEQRPSASTGDGAVLVVP